MPATVTVAAFVFGAILLLIALLSGGFKLFGAEISGSVGKSGRIVAAIAGVFFIAVGLLNPFERSTPSDNSVTKTDVLEGHWEGQVTQPDYGTYSVVLELSDCQIGKECGSATYPELSCGGRYTLSEVNGNSYVLRENITYGDCIDGLKASLKHVAGNSWEITWYEDSEFSADADLTKTS